MSNQKVALITGISGQDGSYLAELLLSKNYKVVGIVRRSSSNFSNNIEIVKKHPQALNGNLTLMNGDLLDASSVTKIINDLEPDEVYNLAAQSHVGVSFANPIYTSNVNSLGSLRILEAIRLLGLTNKTKFYQASTSELYGSVRETPQNENTPFYPLSPYGVAKLYAYWITVNYRETYNIFACNGILFNHESPRRGTDFVTRKITHGLANICQGLDKCLYLGNLDSLRDWGHAKDYVRMQWMMLQQKEPTDLVISSGSQNSVRDFIKLAADCLGISIKFEGNGINETAIITKIKGSKAPYLKVGDVIVRINPEYFRPLEVHSLLGDSSKARALLGWQPEISLKDLCNEMVSSDLAKAKKMRLMKDHDLEN